MNGASFWLDKAPYSVRCWRLVRIRLTAPGAELQPGLDIQSDEDIDTWVRENVESAYHPCGTARMGQGDDPDIVVDTDCRVRGLRGVRVVDASVFPTVPYGNINAPTIMVAEKAADAILGKVPLSPIAASTWIDPNWQTQQRTGVAVRG